ncbi:MAG TPA: FecR family protein [Candidatus Sulfotelmatobacter sp.]|nr:FecR family protein [Candidatus Sulfotelmatobacter sp.]
MPRKLLAMLVVVVGLALRPPGAEAAAAPAGEVLAVAGACTVVTGGQQQPLKAGDAVHAGDTLDVPVGARLKLRMNDGSVLALAANSRITIQAYEVASGGQQREARLSLAAGLLRATVAKLTQPSHFEVDTATGVAAVRGTDWFIEAAPGATQVGVLEGTVTLASATTARSVTIPARWGARVEAGKDPVPARVWSPEEFAADIARTDLK